MSFDAMQYDLLTASFIKT